jgi:hypothetical protein
VLRLVPGYPRTTARRASRRVKRAAPAFLRRRRDSLVATRRRRAGARRTCSPLHSVHCVDSCSSGHSAVTLRPASWTACTSGRLEVEGVHGVDGVQRQPRSGCSCSPKLAKRASEPGVAPLLLRREGRLRACALRLPFCGGGGIRTHDSLSTMPVFKTGALNRSATPPTRRGYHTRWQMLIEIEIELGVRRVSHRLASAGPPNSRPITHRAGRVRAE